MYGNIKGSINPEAERGCTIIINSYLYKLATPSFPWLRYSGYRGNRVVVGKEKLLNEIDSIKEHNETYILVYCQ